MIDYFSTAVANPNPYPELTSPLTASQLILNSTHNYPTLAYEATIRSVRDF